MVGYGLHHFPLFEQVRVGKLQLVVFKKEALRIEAFFKFRLPLKRQARFRGNEEFLNPSAGEEPGLGFAYLGAEASADEIGDPHGEAED